MSASTQSAEHRWPTAALDDKSSSQQERAFCCAIGRMAVRNLYAELSLYPKPGLVSLIDNGSHDDMTAVSFVRSLFSLRHYFIHITKAGIDTVSFKILKQLGIEAERCMLTARLARRSGTMISVSVRHAQAVARTAPHLPGRADRAHLFRAHRPRAAAGRH